MIGNLGHDHLGQHAGAGRALFNRLRWLGRRFHRAGASVFLAHILDDGQLRRNIFVTLTGLFPDGPQILLAGGTVFFRIRQIMHDALPLEIPRQAAGRRSFSAEPTRWRQRWHPFLRSHPAWPALLLPLAEPPKQPQTAPVDRQKVARFCGCAWHPLAHATGSRFYVAPCARDPVAPSDPSPSVVGSLDLPEDVMDPEP